MTLRQPRYSKEEFAKRGNEIYQAQIKERVEKENYGRVVAIDIETAVFELGEQPMTAVNKLYQKYPDAQPWVIRIGHDAVYRFGSRSIIKLYKN